jgi:hypothetical protein
MTPSESAGKEFAEYVVHLASGVIDITFELEDVKEATSDFSEDEFVASAIAAFKNELVDYLHLRDEN